MSPMALSSSFLVNELLRRLRTFFFAFWILSSGDMHGLVGEVEDETQNLVHWGGRLEFFGAELHTKCVTAKFELLNHQVGVSA